MRRRKKFKDFRGDFIPDEQINNWRRAESKIDQERQGDWDREKTYQTRVS